MRSLATLLVVATLVAGGALAASSRTVELTMQDHGCPQGADRFCLLPGTLSVDEGENLTLQVTNQGTHAHNLTFAAGTPEALAQHGHPAHIPPGESITLSIPAADLATALEEGGPQVTLRCGIDGHAALGEHATLTVANGEEEQNPQPLGWGWAALAMVGAALVGLRRRR